MRRFVPLVAACALVVGCGTARETAKPPPRLPSALAEQLARESDAIAGALDGGDFCRAHELGAALRAHATAEIGRIPARYRESLSSGVNAVVTQLPACVPAVPAHETDEDENASKTKADGKKNPKGRGKAKGHR